MPVGGNSKLGKKTLLPASGDLGAIKPLQQQKKKNHHLKGLLPPLPRSTRRHKCTAAGLLFQVVIVDSRIVSIVVITELCSTTGLRSILFLLLTVLRVQLYEYMKRALAAHYQSRYLSPFPEHGQQRTTYYCLDL